MATYLIYGNADALVASENAIYATARSGSTLAVNNLVIDPNAYNILSVGIYYIGEVLFLFDTSTVLGTIVSATFRVNTTITGGSGSHSTTVRYLSWASPATTEDWQSGTAAAALPEACSFTATANLAAQYNLALSLLTNINQAGSTGLMVVPSAHITGTAPADATNNVLYRSLDTAGTDNDPLLRVAAGQAVRATGAVSTTVSGNVAVAYPTLDADDILAIALTASDNVVSTMPAGWTLKQGTNNGTGLRTEIWWARAAGSESGTVTMTRTSGNAAVARMVSVAGCITTGDPIEAITQSAAFSSVTVTAATLTTLTNAALVAFVASATGGGSDTSLTYANSASAYSGTDPAFIEEFDSTHEPRPYVFASAANNNAGGATTLTVTVPAGTTTGDVLLCWVTVRVTTTTVTRTSPVWTLHDSLSDGTNAITRLLWYVVPSSGGDRAGTVLSFALGTLQKASCCLAVIRNANTTTPFQQSARQANASSVNSTAPAITPSAANTLVLNYYGTATGTTSSSITAGYTRGFESASTGGGTATRTTSLFATRNTRLVSGGASGSAVAVFSAAATNVGWHVAIAAANASANPLAMAFATDNKTTAGATGSRTATLTAAAVNTGVLLAFKPVATGGAFSQSLAASLTAAATLLRLPSRRVVSSVTATAAQLSSARKAIAASLSVSASLLRLSFRAIANSLTPSASVASLRVLARTFSASLAPAAAIVKQSARLLASSVTPAGAVATLRALVRTVSASLAPAASVARQSARLLAASLTPAATLTALRSVAQTLSASLAPAGAVVRRAAKSVAASVTAAGAIASLRALVRTVSASLTPAGSMARQSARLLAASLTPAATLTALRSVARTLSASLTPAAAIVRRGTRTLAASLTPAATVARFTARTLSASVTAAASVLALRSAVRTLTASLTAAASLTRKPTRILSASLAPAAAVVRRAARAVAATLAATANASKRTTKTLAALLTPTGLLASTLIPLVVAGLGLITAALTWAARIASSLTGTASVSGALDATTTTAASLSASARVAADVAAIPAISGDVTATVRVAAELSHLTDN